MISHIISSLPSVDVSVVIPVYGSELTLRTLVDRVRKVFADLGRSWEIVFVDDCGPDRAGEVLRELHAADPAHVVVVHLMRNFGQHNAIMCGFHHARGTYVVTMDDDLQNPPEEIPKLLAEIETGQFDLVYGVIVDQKHHGLVRNIGSQLITWFGQYAFQNRVRGSSYRIIRRELAQSILPYNLNFTFIDGLLAWSTQRIGSVPVQHAPRGAGRSGYSTRKLFSLAFNMFTNFSLLPLQVISLTGFISAGIGLGLGTFYLIWYLLGYITVPGFASVIIAVLVMGGVQLLALGVMGEYLGRIHLNINHKPQFVVRSILPTRPRDGEPHP